MRFRGGDPVPILGLGQNGLMAGFQNGLMAGFQNGLMAGLRKTNACSLRSNRNQEPRKTCSYISDADWNRRATQLNRRDMERQPRRAASIAAMSIFFMPIIAVAGSDQMQKPIVLAKCVLR